MTEQDQSDEANERLKVHAAWLQARDWWGYPESLFWIVLRDERSVAWYTANSKNWETGQASFLAAMVHVALADIEDAALAAAINADPTREVAMMRPHLMGALYGGHVRAKGRRNGIGDRLGILPEDWIGFEIDDGPGLPETVNAWHRQWRGMPAAGPVWWSDLLFDRRSLVATFPRTNAQHSWWPAAQEVMKAWIVRPEAESEMKARCGPNPSLREKGRILSGMAQEAGKTWTEGSIRNALSG